MKKIKILVVDYGNVNGGIENFIFNVFKDIDKTKIQMDFLVYNKECYNEKLLISEGSEIYHTNKPRENYFKCKKYIKSFFIRNSNKYNFIWLQTCSASSIFAHKLAHKYTTAKVITHAHASKSEAKNFIVEVIINFLSGVNRKKLLKVSDYYFACSKNAGTYLFGKKIIYNKHFHVIKNGISVDKFRYSEERRKKIRRELNLNDKDFVVGNVGRITAIKNHDFLIKIFLKILEYKPNSTLLIIGNGDLEIKIKHKIKQLGLEPKVKLLGEKENVNEYLNTMDLFVFPSKFEGLGIAVIEAQTSGLPCLITDRLPKELYITDIVYSESLEEKPDRWAKDSLAIGPNKKRDLYYKYTIESGFDIKTTIKGLEKFFIGRIT